MLGKKVKTIIKILLWGYIVIHVAPDACDTIVRSVSTIAGEGFKWVGGKMWEGVIARGEVHGMDEDKIIGGIIGKMFEKNPPPLPTEGEGLLPGTAKFNEFINNLVGANHNSNATSMLNKMIQKGSLDPTSEAMARDLLEKGYTIAKER